MEWILYNNDNDLSIEIKDGKWKIKELNYKLRFIKEDEYIIEDIKGTIKEYLDCSLIFEGQYMNGKRNGKGKEYDIHNKLKFEGEYINGKRNGKGKEFGYFGNLEYEGEYLNGERTGKGKEYGYNGNLEFEGEYLNGEKKKK